MNETEIAIIGAGIAGCYAASVLSASGHKVTLVEKSRGLGGRCSLRYLKDKQSIDLGAASFSQDDLDSMTGTNSQLQSVVAQWKQQQQLADWPLSQSSFTQPEQRSEATELCGTPTMNQLHRDLAKDAELMTMTRIEDLVHFGDNHWQLVNTEGLPVLKAKKVIITAPALQTQSLYEWQDDWRLVIDAAAAASLPQWVCALSFEKQQNQLADVYRGDHPVLAQAVRDSGKPGRRFLKEVWVLHSSVEWANGHLDTPPEEAAELMAKAFAETLGINQKFEILTSHRWLLSRHDVAAIPGFCLWDAGAGLGICGDWLGGGGIVGALNSSEHLCRLVLANNQISGGSDGQEKPDPGR